MKKQIWNTKRKVWYQNNDDGVLGRNMPINWKTPNDEELQQIKEEVQFKRAVRKMSELSRM
jgi:hypothetical protein